ncbi:uncharacterized protein EI90DRAFT_2902605 [Cantharellus anzutake]|uniref:uncharacterized protein n=1 Tax=Cantharellus anzutake TaxID=1750568 RepID=UPI001908F8D6|nr:uncharacterized protein EI90DRAFT_2902605 [Cantharellus anzutake]KAF8342571.1 hypothetical protein EI90DRAFT_2902605 [Cantharellus anzutake]
MGNDPSFVIETKSPAPLQASPTVELLSLAVHRICTTPPRLIASPPTQPRRAAVSLVMRIRPPEGYPLPEQSAYEVPSLEKFFEQDWARHPEARAELLFIRRDKSKQNFKDVRGAGAGASTNGASAHVAFPGGRTEESDEGALYTAMRQTWEEIGLDLAEKEFTCVGQLDDREITTSLGKRLLMILSPFVFLYLSPYEMTIEPPEEESDVTLHWVPLSALLSPLPKWSFVTVDISSRLAPRHNILRILVRWLVGNMRFRALVITEEDIEELDDLHVSSKAWEKRREREGSPKEELRLWGLTLGMTLDLIRFMYPRRSELPPGDPSSSEFDEIGNVALMPSMASVFPRFSIPDVNFWIWVFGRRYRAVLRAWEASVVRSRITPGGSSTERRINWSGQALSTFYAAVRKALIVVIVGRALGLLAALFGLGWWLRKRFDGWLADV